MTRPLRIGYLVPQFPGQTHIFFWREIDALERLGHEVRLLSTRKPPEGLIAHGWSDAAMARTTYLDRLDPVAAIGTLSELLPRGLYMWMLKGGFSFSRDVLLTLAAAWQLRCTAQEDGIEHVHVHSCGRAALIAALAERMGGPSYSLTLHGPLSDYGSGQRFKWQRAAFATVITEKLRDEAAEALGPDLPGRVRVRPMGVDTEVLKRAAPYEPVSHGRPMRLFSCARLNVVKGHQDLMTAMRQLLDMGVDVRLEIAGEDDAGGTGYRRELEAHLKQLHLRDHVKLLGAIDADQVKAKLMAADAFVLASWHEPLGVAYMEAMACGVPVFGTDSGGVRELIRDGHTGILVPPQNPGVLARAIRDFAGKPDYARQLSAAARAHVEAHFRSSLGAELLAEEICRVRESE
ncbi:exopolysaccharide biosynthesis GT4 family glycosyltransferase EpsE [Roseivivax sediminis]|uniref:Glycosyltransferase involved in cell wall bisynthesis n=1 Tax=Roseivivax sediminis TaxID=936889 RepID=A0A1I1ULP0_9RHOB|nr:exopolysaccharide biosynthesis GT4 family glycosyltransferase EpsE [Roseivivax sediminis]SFD71677.1 Glycosyltransferase involved in cell wall bisynthesis [Roseivivax sediminis]